MIHHRKPEFKAIMGEVQQKLRHLFGTEGEVLALTASGTGAMVAALQGLFAPGETVLVIQGGKFGERWTEIARARGLEVRVLAVPEGRAVNPAEVAAALAADPNIAGVFVQLSETSTGVQHPVRELAEIIRKTPALLVVDGISGLGITPCPMDEWGLDCLLTGSQKGLMLPPGLAFLALSERAWAKAGSVESGNFYFNLAAERDNIRKGQTCFTPAIGLLVALNESLSIFMEEGLENIFRKQWALTCMARAGVRALGLELFAPDHPAWGLTSLRLPAGVKSSAVLGIAARKFNVIMAAGQGDAKDLIIRIGHMGWVDWADLAAGLHALAEACREAGIAVNTDNYLEQALAAYWQAWNNGYVAS
jgi:aspartate aminotransferase-like enzyme